MAAFLPVFACLFSGWPAQVESAAPSEDVSDLLAARIEHRVIKTFDFDERRHGNFESMPMNWRSITAAGYPRFLTPAFDETTGRGAAPSFRFSIQSGSVGAHYLAKDIDVLPGTDYRLTAWIRPKGLVRARAYLTAYYLDHALRKIDVSEKRSAVVRGAGDSEPWRQVVIDLPGGFENARWIGLSCRIEQAPKPSGEHELFRSIRRRDARASAWFDDITVMRLPRIGMALNAPANVFLADDEITCTVTMLDLNGAGLDIKLDLLDAEDRIIEIRRFRGAELLGEAGKSIRFRNLPAGLYRAKLTTHVNEHFVSEHERVFVRLNPDLGGRKRQGRGFGIVTDRSLFEHIDLGQNLLQNLSPEIVKIPLWREDLSSEDIVRGDRRVDGLVRVLHRMGVTVVGVLDAPPAILAEQYGLLNRSLLAVLASDPDRWRPYLMLILTRHGQSINAWQVGPEGGADRQQRVHLRDALANLQSEAMPLIGRPILALPGSVLQQPDVEAGAIDMRSMNVPAHISSQDLQEQLAAGAAGDSAARWATFERPDADRYMRRWRLAEFARKLILARASGIDAVFVQQPWRFIAADGVTTVAPAEEYILLRTISQLLGGLEPIASPWVADGIEAWLFVDEGRESGTLAVWTAGDGDGEIGLVLDLPETARQFDLWGNGRSARAVAGGRSYAVGAMPILIGPVDPRRLKLLTGLRVDDPVLQATVQEHERIITLNNTLEGKLEGILHLEPPNGCRIRPKKILVDLAPGESLRVEVFIRLPTNYPTGDYVLEAHLLMEGEDASDLRMRAPLRVNAPGLEVNVMAFRDGDDMNIVQRITNRTNESLDLRAYLVSPDRTRDVRTIKNLTEGQTVIREYVLKDADKIAGQNVRLSVERIDGSLRQNSVIKLGP